MANTFADKFRRAGCPIRYEDVKERIKDLFKFIRGPMSDEDLLFRPEDSWSFSNVVLMNLGLKRTEDNRELVLACLVNIRKSDAQERRKQAEGQADV
jgi:hypothetical protein